MPWELSDCNFCFAVETMNRSVKNCFKTPAPKTNSAQIIWSEGRVGESNISDICQIRFWESGLREIKLLLIPTNLKWPDEKSKGFKLCSSLRSNYTQHLLLWMFFLLLFLFHPKKWWETAIWNTSSPSGWETGALIFFKMPHE